MVDNYGYPYIALTGGGDGSLDSLDGSLVKDGDFAVVVLLATQKSYIYVLDADSGAAESSPTVIAPDSNAGDKRWILTSFGTALIPGAAATDINFLQEGTGAVTRTMQDKARDEVNVFDFLSAAEKADVIARTAGVDCSASFQLAVNKVQSTDGAILRLPPGIIRLDSQITVDRNSIVFYGAGSSAGTNSLGTTLDLRYASGAGFLMGNASTIRNGIQFKHLHITGASNAGTQYFFESRYTRGLHWRDISFAGCHGFLQGGRAGEASYMISMEGIEGNMTTTHGHFINAINVPGSVWLQGYGHIEGHTTPPDGSMFMNFATTSERPDGIQISGWTIRQFDRFLNFRNGCANVLASHVIFDGFKNVGIYADTDEGSINGLHISNSHIAGLTAASGTVSRGIVIAKTTEACTAVQLIGNKVVWCGAEGIWVTGDLFANVNSNTVWQAAQYADDTYGSFRIGPNIKGTLVGNISYSTEANQPKYGYHIETAETSPAFEKSSNVSVGHVTGAEGA